MYSPQADGHSPAGFPHSDISGSAPVSGSPELFAAVHVLHRLWLPRHPPYALRSLTLSLRHASRSRAGFDSRKSSPDTTLQSFRYPWTITIYKRCISHLNRYSIVNEQWQTYCRISGDQKSPRELSGADRDRTDDLRLAKPALSQLSYSPVVAESLVTPWWARAELNCRPHAYQACALTT
jgi:hypothetical protein